jgi:hypothetical protein
VSFRPSFSGRWIDFRDIRDNGGGYRGVPERGPSDGNVRQRQWKDDGVQDAVRRADQREVGEREGDRDGRTNFRDHAEQEDHFRADHEDERRAGGAHACGDGGPAAGAGDVCALAERRGEIPKKPASEFHAQLERERRAGIFAGAWKQPFERSYDVVRFAPKDAFGRD